MRPLDLVLPSALLALFPLAIGCADVEDPLPPPTIDWAECTDTTLFDCGVLSVPVDHADPYGPRFNLPVLRAPALVEEERLGSLVVNPGGPGGSGVQLAKGAAFVLPPAVRNRFDIVGFDPRGEGKSSPSINCISDLDPFIALDTTPDDAAEEEALAAQSRALAEGCGERSADLLPFVGTDSIVRDMDLLRQALGDEQLTYLGFSYGTFLGAIYADTFPDKVRALVLDAAVDPSVSAEEMIRGQALGFEQELDEMLAWCKGDSECALNQVGGAPTDPAAVYDAVQAAVEANPLPTGEDRTLGPGEFSYGVSAALYQPSRWPKLSDALAKAAEGDGSDLLALADGYTGRSPDGSFDNSLEVYYAVTSVDSPAPRDPARIAALAADVLDKAPRVGAYLPYSLLPSVYWPVDAWRSASPVRAPGAPPILVVGGTRDPATPYVWSQSLASQLPGASLLTRDGDGHTSFLHGNACIDKAVIDYLVDLRLPEDGTICDD